MPSKKQTADHSCGEPPPVKHPAVIRPSLEFNPPVSFDNAISILRTITNNPSVALTFASTTLSKSDLDKITNETKYHIKSVEYTVTVHDGLTGSRAAVIDDTGPTIPEVPLQLFFAHVLPCPSIVDKTHEITDALAEGDDPAYVDGRWTAFPHDPAKTEEHETTVFRRLERVAKAVIEQAQIISPVEPLTRFRNDPDHCPESQWRKTSCRPDSFFVLRKRRSTTVAHWADIAATGEFKRKDGDFRHLEDVRRYHSSYYSLFSSQWHQDSKKVLWNMHQTLRDDPCRRFTFGFTIENRSMRIWFCSRAEILVSRPFDFITVSLVNVYYSAALTEST